MFSRKIFWYVAALLLLSSRVPASAQTTGSDRPFRMALFGAQRSEKVPQTLDVSAFLLEAYDDNLFATLGPADPNTKPVSGFYTMLTPGVNYRLAHPRFQVGITEASALGYYPDVSQVKSISHNLGAGFSAQTGRGTTVLLNQTVAYSPSYLYGLFPKGSNVSPGDITPDAPNYAVNDVESYSYGTTATVSHGLSSRMTALAGGNYRYTNFTRETAAQQDLESEGLDGQLSYKQNRNLAFRFAYHYLTGNVAYGGRVHANENRVEGGISYSRPLSPSRSMTLAFNLGSSAVSSNDAPAELQVPDRLFRASADASIDYPFARSWRTHGAFRRGLEFIPGLAQPVYANGVMAGLEGLLHRRLEIGFAGGYSQGRSALTVAATQYDTYNASAYAQYALTSSTAIHVEYFYYSYDFVGDVLVISGGPQRLQRNGVRVGLRLLVPAFRG